MLAVARGTSSIARTKRDLKVFSGTAHPTLARAICHKLGISLGKSEVRKFSNDNIFVRILENVREKDCFVVQPSCPPVNDGLMELFIMIDALKSASARRVTAVMPYYPYVRSDKKDEPRISVAARLVADLLEAAGADRVLTMTLHSEQVQGFFHVPVDQLSAVQLVCRHFRRKDLSKAVVIAPDAGSAKRAGRYAERLGLPLAVADKRRSGAHDDTSRFERIVGDVDGKDVLMFDDEIATGGSMLGLLAYLRQEHNVGKVYAGAAHGVLCGDAVERLEASSFEQIVITDSVPLPRKKRSEKIKVVSAAPLLARAIYNIHTGASVSALFT